jgi:hypothetical protein
MGPERSFATHRRQSAPWMLGYQRTPANSLMRRNLQRPPALNRYAPPLVGCAWPGSATRFLRLRFNLPQPVSIIRAAPHELNAQLSSLGKTVCCVDRGKGFDNSETIACRWQDSSRARSCMRPLLEMAEAWILPTGSAKDSSAAAKRGLIIEPGDAASATPNGCAASAAENRRDAARCALAGRHTW